MTHQRLLNRAEATHQHHHHGNINPSCLLTRAALALPVLARGGAVVIGIGPGLAEADDVGHVAPAAVPEGVVDLVVLVGCM